MSGRTRFTVGLATALLVLAGAVGAAAHDGRHHDDGNRGDRDEAATVFSSSLAASMPTDPAIHAVTPGGLPWVGRGSVRISDDGEVAVRIRGLVIPVAHGTFPAGVASPVTTVTASLYCAPDASAAAATTQAVPISAAGDARIEQDVTLPATCLAPAVLIHPNGIAAAYIAASGWR